MPNSIVQYFHKKEQQEKEKLDKKNDKQIIIHNNPQPIIINHDLNKIQNELNKMLENGKVSNDEYEKLKKGDPTIFKKVFDENEEFRKLLLDTHQEEVIKKIIKKF